MEYINDNPLNSYVTIYEKSTTKDEYGDPAGYTATITNCAVFEGQKKTLNKTGQEVLSTARVAVKSKPSIDSLVYLSETFDLLPPTDSQEIIAITTIRDEWQEIVGYWIWL